MAKTVNLGPITAYGIAVKNGFVGTEKEWLESLKSPPGEQGPSSESVEAENVVFTRDMYSAYAIGNIKLDNGRGKYASVGDNLADVLDAIFDKELYPTTTQPYVTLSFPQAKAYEVGTSIEPSYSAALNPGRYTYGPDTGITATSWTVTDTDGNISDTERGGFPGFIVSDTTDYKITATAEHNAGEVPLTNKDNEYPAGRIKAGFKTATSKAVIGYRNTFYGTLTHRDELTSDIIRGLKHKSGEALTNGSKFTIPIPVGALRVVFAYPATLRDVTHVVDVRGLQSDIADSFIVNKRIIQVADARGTKDDGTLYDPIDYKVFEVPYGSPIGTENTYEVEI